MKIPTIKTKYLATTFRLLKQIRKKEDGQAYILILLFLVVGALVITPTLAFVGTGLQTGMIYENETQNLYALDSGVEHGLWEIKHNEMQTFPSYSSYAYYEYDADNQWEYDMAESVNDKSLHVTVQNAWIPYDIPVPSPSSAANVAENANLIIGGGATGNNKYTIKILFNPDCAEDNEDLRVQSIGVWIPPHYNYVDGSSNLENDSVAPWYSVPTVFPDSGGQAIIWNFSSLNFNDMPPAGNTMSGIITFDYTSAKEERLDAIPWIKTTGVAQVSFAWDNRFAIYHVISSNTEGTTDSYTMLPDFENLGIYNGALSAAGDIDIAQDGTVSGDIIYGGTFTYSAGFQHLEGELINEEPELPTQEEIDFFAEENKQEAMAAETYLGDYNIPPGNGVDTIYLGPIYISGNLTVEKDNITFIRGPIYVEGTIVFGKNSSLSGFGGIIAGGDMSFQQINDFGTAADSFIMSLNGNIVFHQSATLDAVVFAVNGNVLFNQDATIAGSVLAGGNITVDQNSTITANPSYSGNLPGYSSGTFKNITWTIDS